MKHLGDTRKTAGWFNRPNEVYQRVNLLWLLDLQHTAHNSLCKFLHQLLVYLHLQHGRFWRGHIESWIYCGFLIFFSCWLSHRSGEVSHFALKGHHEWLFLIEVYGVTERWKADFTLIFSWAWNQGRGLGLHQERDEVHLLRVSSEGPWGKGKCLKTLRTFYLRI